MVQPRLAGAKSCFRLGPNLCLDTAATHCSRHFAVLKEKHFRTALLRGRATRVRDRGHDYTLAAVVSLINQTI